jgi:hypothetical protein
MTTGTQEAKMTKLATTYRLVDMDAVDPRGIPDAADRILAVLLARANARRVERERAAADLNAPGLTPAESLGLVERFNRALSAEIEASNAFHAAVAAAEVPR